MTDRPEDRSEERRRTGPLGDDGTGESQETRAQPDNERSEPGTDEAATRQIPAQEGRREPAAEEPEEGRRSLFGRRSRRGAEAEEAEDADRETRVIRTPGTTRQEAYPRGYFEAAEEREDRLRDMYGGVDWLASFLGFVFAAVAGSVLSLIAGLILAPLGFSLDLGAGGLGAAVITGLVIVGILVFLTYFFGGYVAGRLARFDGGRNGAMTVVWALVIGALLVAIGGFLPGGLFEVFQGFVQDTLSPLVGGLLELGAAGLAILAGVLLVALLGGLLGGRMGSRYHSDIDRTT